MGASSTKTNHTHSKAFKCLPPPHQIQQIQHDLDQESQRHHLILHSKQVLTSLNKKLPKDQRYHLLDNVNHGSTYLQHQPNNGHRVSRHNNDTSNSSHPSQHNLQLLGESQVFVHSNDETDIVDLLLCNDRVPGRGRPLPDVPEKQTTISAGAYGFFGSSDKSYNSDDSRTREANNILNSFIASHGNIQPLDQDFSARRPIIRNQSSDCENDSPNSENDYDFGAWTSDTSLYVALYSFEPDNDNQIPLNAGEIIHFLSASGDWCEAVNKNGQIGWVPSNYIAPASISQHPWYHGAISRDTAEYLLSSGINGSFLVRESQSHPGSRSISLRYEGKVFHYRIREEDGQFFIMPSKAFGTLVQLIHHHSINQAGMATNLLYPAPKQVDPNAILENPSATTIDAWEIDRSDIILQQQIGIGQWGVVNEAIWAKHKLRVAVKMLKEEMMDHEGEFLHEAELMKNMRHPNLVQLLGVCTSEAPIYIVTEFMTKGNLLDFLRDCDHAKINGFVLMYMAAQICSGMSYLESHNYIHRDLAARNCLVSDNHLVKVADFGLTRYVQPDEIYTAHLGAKFPIKWTAPEGLAFNKFSSKSDIWSFGVLLWEIATYGMTPYPGIELSEVFDTISSGHRMCRPTGCPEPVHTLMQHCWAWEAEERPTFRELLQQFQALLYNPDIFALIERQEAIDKELLEREHDLMKMKNFGDCQQEQFEAKLIDSGIGTNTNSESPKGSENSSSCTQRSVVDNRFSMTQFDPKWAIEEFHRKKNENLKHDKTDQHRSTLSRKVAPVPPKRTSSYRDSSQPEHSHEMQQIHPNVAEDKTLGDGTATTLDNLEKMFQSLSQVKLSKQSQPSTIESSYNGHTTAGRSSSSFKHRSGDDKQVRPRSKPRRNI